MKRLLLGGAWLLLLVLLISGCTSQAKPAAAPTPEAKVGPPAASQALRQENGGPVIATGAVVPARSAALSLPSAGIVVSAPVKVGQQVQAGQLLAQLDTRQLELQLAQADANVATAQAKLDQFNAGPSAAALAAAQQDVVSAQAAYDKVHAGAAAPDVAAAQAALAAAQQNYAKVRAGPTADELAGLSAQVDNAHAALAQAQAAYDKVQGAPDIGARPEALQLQQATNNFNVAAAALKEARSHPTQAELAAAASQVQAAQAALDQLAPDTATIQAKLAALEDSKAALARLQPAAGDRAVLEAGVKAAQAARDLAAEQVAEARLVAPMAGTIVSVDVQPGEYAALGTPVLRLADTSTWQIDTTDLTELSVAQIKEGMPATVTFDAIPGLQLSGRVSQIKPYGDTHQGDIVYTVTVTPDRQDERLRWNMTAKVTFAPG